jgi:hypothetical protein
MDISVTGYSTQTLTLPCGDTIGMYDLVDGSYWSATGEFDVTGRVIGWGPDGIAIAYETGSLTCDPQFVRLAAGQVAR